MAFLNSNIGTYLPRKVLTNDEISTRFPEWSSEKILSKIGISERHIAEGEDVIDMAEKACKDLFAKLNFDKSKVDYLILVTSSPRYALPTSACILQDLIDLPRSTGAIDINLGCSGYVYGVELAKALIESKTKTNILLVTSETYSKYIDPSDKGNLSLFGDGATCTLITSKSLGECWKIGKTQSGTDGSGHEKLIVKNQKLFMDGKSVFEFTASVVVRELKKFLNTLNQNTSKDFIFHQANEFMLHYMRKKIGIHENQFLLDFIDKGNTVSSTIPFVINSRGITTNDTVLAGFGVGLSWSFCELKAIKKL